MNDVRHEHDWKEANQVEAKKDGKVIGYIIQYTCSCGQGKSEWEDA